MDLHNYSRLRKNQLVELVSEAFCDENGNDFYIPSAQQIEEICNAGYEYSSQAYKNLRSFLKNEFDIYDEEAAGWCSFTWNHSYKGESPQVIIDKMKNEDLIFVDEIQVKEFVHLLEDAYNCTRLLESRGNTRKEIGKLVTINGTAIVEGEPIRTAKKIYPNDPCPCGSGKKYKNCCGKRH